MSSPTLPEGWVLKYDETYNQPYYVNTITGQSHWTLPSSSHTTTTEYPATVNSPPAAQVEGGDGPQDRGMKTNLAMQMLQGSSSNNHGNQHGSGAGGLAGQLVGSLLGGGKQHGSSNNSQGHSSSGVSGVVANLLGGNGHNSSNGSSNYNTGGSSGAVGNPLGGSHGSDNSHGGNPHKFKPQDMVIGAISSALGGKTHKVSDSKPPKPNSSYGSYDHQDFSANISHNNPNQHYQEQGVYHPGLGPTQTYNQQSYSNASHQQYGPPSGPPPQLAYATKPNHGTGTSYGRPPPQQEGFASSYTQSTHSHQIGPTSGHNPSPYDQSTSYSGSSAYGQPSQNQSSFHGQPPQGSNSPYGKPYNSSTGPVPYGQNFPQPQVPQGSSGGSAAAYYNAPSSSAGSGYPGKREFDD